MRMKWLVPVFICILFPAVAAGAAREMTPPVSEPASLLALVPALRLDGPLSFCGEPVPLGNQEVKERLEKELLLTLWDRAQVVLWLKRSNRFLPVIDKELRTHGLPGDLKYVAVVESALLSHARSAAGAMGYWQFMASTARRCGLTVDSHKDERCNIFASTKAACRYFNKLRGLFESWTLVTAAYNFGEERLRDEITRQEVNDFYKLYLPLETQRYVFKILAAKLILSDPARYGFQITAEDLYPPLEFDRVTFTCPAGLPIQVVAKAASTYYKKIKELNPELRGRYLDKGEHILAVPKNAGEVFYARFNRAMNAWRREHPYRTYVVQKGDNLSTIASRFDVPLHSLLRLNDLSPESRIHPGKKLIISR